MTYDHKNGVWPSLGADPKPTPQLWAADLLSLDSKKRAVSARVLAKLGAAAGPSVPDIVMLLQDESTHVRKASRPSSEHREHRSRK